MIWYRNASLCVPCLPAHLTSLLKLLRLGKEGKIKRKLKKALDAQELQACCEVTGKYNLIIRYTAVMAFARLEHDFPVIDRLQGSLPLLSQPQMRAQLRSCFLCLWRGFKGPSWACSSSCAVC